MIRVSELKVGDVVEVHTKSSVYTYELTGEGGQSVLTGNNPRYKGPFSGYVVGTQTLGGFDAEALCLNGRLHFSMDRSTQEKSQTLKTSPIQRLVLNGTVVHTNFARPAPR
jgi:hypothetical protein